MLDAPATTTRAMPAKGRLVGALVSMYEIVIAGASRVAIAPMKFGASIGRFS
ncbi:hypothetical protein [Methylocystis echinoides]|uniref:hypothetical protein n=1 Tax=Methylocystis echinoides TaxID=29468 RepID=UPI002493AAAE|nr:hypothetical protein [Methylocystis echinoides]